MTDLDRARNKIVAASHRAGKTITPLVLVIEAVILIIKYLEEKEKK